MATHDPNRVLIFDTTLRDGEQSPGCSMTLPEKLRIARALADLGVDVIEAGFPCASPRRFRSRTVPSLGKSSDQSLPDLRAAIVTTSNVPPRRCTMRRAGGIHVFLATSAIHREYKLKMAKDEIVRTP